MRILRTLAALVLPLLAAGCYMSTQPLITPDKAVFPYEKIVYTEGDNAKPVTMVHQGDAYVAMSDKGEKIELRFMPVKDDLYVAQMGGKTADGEAYLYGLVKFDAANKKAVSYAVVADKSDIGPGLPACSDSDSTVCLTDLQPYIDHALGQIGDDKKPAATYTIIELK